MTIMETLIFPYERCLADQSTVQSSRIDGARQTIKNTEYSIALYGEVSIMV